MTEINPITSNIGKAVPILRKYLNWAVEKGADLTKEASQQSSAAMVKELEDAGVDPALLNGASLPQFLAAVSEDIRASLPPNFTLPENPPIEEASKSESAEAPTPNPSPPGVEAPPPNPPPPNANADEGGWFDTLKEHWPWIGVAVGAIVALIGFFKGSSDNHSGSVLAGIGGAAVAVFSLLFKLPGLVGAEKKPAEEVAPA